MIDLDFLKEDKYNVPISDEEYTEMSKLSYDKEIDIGTVEFRSSTAIDICNQYLKDFLNHT